MKNHYGAELDVNGWPEWWPVFDERDFCRGYLYYGDKSCLVGALRRTTLSFACETSETAYCAVKGDMLRRLGFYGVDLRPLFAFSDQRPLKEVASFWNETGYRMGYNVAKKDRT